MMKVTKKYSKAFILGIQGALEYRISFLLDIASSALPIVMQYFLWSTIFDSQGTDLVFGYSYHELVIYIIFANLISKFISSGYFKYEIADDIKNGGLNKYITKPIGYGGYRLSCFLGEKLPQFILMYLLLFMAFFIFSGDAVSLKASTILFFTASLLFALIIQFFIYFAVSAIAFFIAEISHLFFVVQILIDIMSGKIVPLDVFGERILYFFNLLPFKYIVYYPTNIINGKLSNQEILAGIYMQCLWIVILGIFSTLIWKKCTKHYMAIGG